MTPRDSRLARRELRRSLVHFLSFSISSAPFCISLRRQSSQSNLASAAAAAYVRSVAANLSIFIFQSVSFLAG